jgi:hypothetical protein
MNSGAELRKAAGGSFRLQVFIRMRPDLSDQERTVAASDEPGNTHAARTSDQRGYAIEKYGRNWMVLDSAGPAGSEITCSLTEPKSFVGSASGTRPLSRPATCILNDLPPVEHTLNGLTAHHHPRALRSSTAPLPISRQH